MALVTGRIMTNNLEENTLEELKLAAQSLRSYYEYDLENDNALVDGSDLSAIAEETSATNEEIAATTDTVAGSVANVAEDMTDMDNMADNLRETVGFFKL